MRNSHLDFIRGSAMMLVLLRHSNVSNRIIQIGWMSVDVFFVLSGFLISSLLIKEYKTTNAVDIRRFLFRRSFKIFPPFYFLIFASLLINYFARDIVLPIKPILTEIFYLQSYLTGISYHTWSLAVEEHFYLLFTGFFKVSVKSNWVYQTKRNIIFLIGLLVLCFLMRFSYSFPHRNETFFGFTYSHLRSDGIIVGILLSYLVEFTSVLPKIKAHIRSLSILAFFLILPGFIFQGGSFFMNTIGLTTANLGFGILCALALVINPFRFTGNSKALYYIYKPLCFIGIHSYSIYLWHLMVKDYLNLLNLDKYTFLGLYLVLSLLIGIVLSFLIERPFLILKERLTISKKLIPLPDEAVVIKK